MDQVLIDDPWLEALLLLLLHVGARSSQLQRLQLAILFRSLPSSIFAPLVLNQMYAERHLSTLVTRTLPSWFALMLVWMQLRSC